MSNCGHGHGNPSNSSNVPVFRGRSDHSSTLDAAGWALFFIWVGVAWLLDVGTGIGFLGIAVITLGMQGVRKLFGLPIEGIWILIGLLLAVAGLWQWTNIQKPLAAFMLIALGMALFVLRVWPESRHRGT